MKNRFVNAVIVGAAVTLGNEIMVKAIKICSDPYERAVAKQKFKRVKDAIFKKSEEESC